MTENSGDQGWSDGPVYPRRAQPANHDGPPGWPDATSGWSEVPGGGDGPPPPPPYRPVPSTPGGSLYGRPVTPQQAGTGPGAWPVAPAPEPTWPPDRRSQPPGGPERQPPAAPPQRRPWPSQAGQAPTVSAPPAAGVPAPPAGGAPPPGFAPGSGPGFPPGAASPPGFPPPTAPTSGFPPGGAPQGFPPGGSPAGHPPGGSPAGHPPVPASVAGARPARRRSRSTVLLAVAVVVLIVQSVLLVDMRLRLDDTRDSLASGQKSTGDRLDALERRTGALERAAGRAFDPRAVATAVKPSVFRVEAGDYSGTAFAVGRPSSSGTDLLTNFHVVEQVYKANQRKVSLVRGDLRYPATISRVSRGHDLALLHTTAKIPRLVPAKSPAASGQQIVVIGAPLGLEGSVTSGVISAIRTDLPSTQSAVVQFDAPINPGNSGGPVVDGSKQVVGIASAKIDAARGVGSVEGIGLAIPISVACKSFSGLC